MPLVINMGKKLVMLDMGTYFYLGIFLHRSLVGNKVARPFNCGVRDKWVWVRGMVTYQANPKLLGLGGGATQGDECMGTRENIIECMYKGPLVILFHVC
jgi:hypothetical protein